MCERLRFLRLIIELVLIINISYEVVGIGQVELDVHGRSYPSSSDTLRNQVISSSARGTSSSGGQIVFPNSNTNENTFTFHKSKHETSHFSPSPVPLDVLKALSSEPDFAKIVKDWVINAEVATANDTTGEQILLGNSGRTFTDSKGKRIVVGVLPPVSRTQITLAGAHSVNGSFLPSSPSKLGVSGRIGPKAPVEKSPAIAVCRPEEQTVPVPVTFEPHIIYHPRCVRVERCGGCCGSDILACEPSEVTAVTVPVRKFQYIVGGEKNLEFLEQEDVLMEKHTKCECRCRTKSHDCGLGQEYREGECLCACRDTEKREACLADGLKVWDPSVCECLCREIKDCNSGFIFNLELCECAAIPSVRRPTQSNRGNRRDRRNHRKN